MLNTIFDTIITNGNFTAVTFMEITFAALICGLVIAGAYMIKNKYSK